MARTRNIKPGFFDNDILGSLSPLTRILFIGLWCIADRDGRLEDRPRRIKKTLLGYDDITAEDTDDMLQQLANNGFIIRYEVDNTKYIQIVNFRKHQNPHMAEKSSEIPPPAGYVSETQTTPTEPTEEGAETETETKPKQKAKRPAKPKADGAVISERFDVFWAAYPRKTSKQAAANAFRKIAPDEELFKKIMQAVELQKQTEAWRDIKYIPFPATWLHNCRWEDEVEVNTNNGENRQQPNSSGNASSSDEGRAQNIGSGSVGGFKDE